MKFAITLLLLYILSGFVSFTAKAQNPRAKYPQNYFRSPVDYPLAIVGNFGELRKNHYHNGLDIRTGGMEGKKIYAVADGYVSRIKISPVGYGNVLYITHPNGYVSVYAHLKQFSDSIGGYVKRAQYLNETWEIELTPDKKALPVKKGDIIALSGNTGSSQGPHLHFEIREEESEVTVNPLLFNFDIPDAVPPVIKNAFIYPLGENSFVNGKTTFLKLPCIGGKGNYKIANEIPLNVTGTFGLAIDAMDQVSASPNPNGVYSIEVKVDGQRVYYHELDKVAFDENRYINSHCDYEEFKRRGAWIMKCFIQPGNKLGIYHRTTNNGYINFTEAGEHYVSYVVKDIEGNSSQLFLKINYTPAPNFQPVPVLKAKAVKLFRYDQPNFFTTNEIKIEMPAYTIYDNLELEYYTSNLDSTKGLPWGKTHYIHNPIVPVHTYYNVSINARNLPEEYKDKAVIVSSEFGHGRCEGGVYENGWIKAKTRTFGSFRVVIDKTAPVIRPVNILPGKNLSKAAGIVVKISDNLSGFKYYKGYIDGKWVLMVYNIKAGTATYKFDSSVGKGRHEFKMVVEDNRGNKSEYNSWFIR